MLIPEILLGKSRTLSEINQQTDTLQLHPGQTGKSVTEEMLAGHYCEASMQLTQEKNFKRAFEVDNEKRILRHE